MRTRQITSGFIGAIASLLAVVAAGCSSEPLSAEEAAEIGVSAQTLGGSSLSTFPAGVECYTEDDCMEGRFEFMDHNCVIPTCTSARKCTYARNTAYSTCECLLPKPGTSTSSRCLISGTTYGYRTCQKRGDYETRWTTCR